MCLHFTFKIPLYGSYGFRVLVLLWVSSSFWKFILEIPPASLFEPCGKTIFYSFGNDYTNESSVKYTMNSRPVGLSCPWKHYRGSSLEFAMSYIDGSLSVFTLHLFHFFPISIFYYLTKAYFSLYFPNFTFFLANTSKETLILVTCSVFFVQASSSCFPPVIIIPT